MNEPRHYEYIFVSWAGQSVSGKTSRYAVYNTRSGDQIGEIRWFGRWRHYTFFPADGTAFSAGCLRDIADLIKETA